MSVVPTHSISTGPLQAPQSAHSVLFYTRILLRLCDAWAVVSLAKVNTQSILRRPTCYYFSAARLAVRPRSYLLICRVSVAQGVALARCTCNKERESSGAQDPTRERGATSRAHTGPLRMHRLCIVLKDACVRHNSRPTAEHCRLSLCTVKARQRFVCIADAVRAMNNRTPTVHGPYRGSC